MSKAKKNPTPEERPELYDSYDARVKPFQGDKAYLDAVLPEHVKKALAEKGASQK